MIKFEDIKEEDLSIVAELYDSESEYKTDLSKMKESYNKIKDNEFYKMIIAKEVEEIVGFAYINIHQDIFEKCKPFMTVWSLRVKETSRRKGIGTKLFKYIEDLAREIDCSFICLIAEVDNLGANSFYKSLNYNKENGYVKFIGR